MKAIAIPAQVTTLEDRIAGNLSLRQLLLLCCPLFLSVAVYYLLPAFGRPSLYKLMVIGLTSLIFGVLAIRLRGKLIIDWLSLRMKYELRPKIYVYNKSSRLAISEEVITHINQPAYTSQKARANSQTKLSNREFSNSYKLLASPSHSIIFKINKGKGLNVQVNEA